MSGHDLVQKWLSDASSDNPAGNLFVSGEFAEADIICEMATFTNRCGSACTQSLTRYCC